jgi:hypothetical protein
MKSQSGKISINILLMIILCAIGILVYVLVSQKSYTDISAHGTNSPQLNMDKKVKATDVFTDGLPRPDSIETFALDETGNGISRKEVFNIDINDDDFIDKITRTRNENGTAHFWYEYKIELNKNGVFFNITPNGFRTTEGAECSLQKLQFIFEPDFKVIKISRPWENSWDTPTIATRTDFVLRNGKIVQLSQNSLGSVCEVKELFFVEK